MHRQNSVKHLRISVSCNDWRMQQMLMCSEKRPDALKYSDVLCIPKYSRLMLQTTHAWKTIALSCVCLQKHLRFSSHQEYVVWLKSKIILKPYLLQGTATKNRSQWTVVRSTLQKIRLRQNEGNYSECFLLEIDKTFAGHRTGVWLARINTGTR